MQAYSPKNISIDAGISIVCNAIESESIIPSISYVLLIYYQYIDRSSI